MALGCEFKFNPTYVHYTDSPSLGMGEKVRDAYLSDAYAACYEEMMEDQGELYRTTLEKLKICNILLWESAFEILIIKLELFNNEFYSSPHSV